MVQSLTSKLGVVALLAILTGPVFGDPGEELIQSINKNNLKGVQLSLDKGADVNRTSDKVGNTPLMIAARNGHVAIMKLLIEKGANIDEPSEFYRETPLMAAAESGSIEATGLLLERGAKVKNRTLSNMTFLMYAAKGGNPAMVRLATEKGLNVNDRDKKGWTALMYAAEGGRTDAVRELIALKADLNARSTLGFSVSGREYSANFYPGDTALTIARATGRAQVAKILEDSGARSYSEELFDRNDLFKRLGSYKVEMKPATKAEFKEIIAALKGTIPNDDLRAERIKKLESHSYSDMTWFVVYIIYEKKQKGKTFHVALVDAKGANLVKNGYSYNQAKRRGDAIVKLREVILIESADPVIAKRIGGERSPVTLTTSLFTSNRKIVRFYTDEK